jgi:hypothetical protein
MHTQIARCPDDGGTNIGDEHRIVGGTSSTVLGDELWMKRGAVVVVDRQLVQCFPRVGIVLSHAVQMAAVRLGLQSGKQGSGGVLDRADQWHIHPDPSADVLAAQVDLQHDRPARVELAIRKVRPEHQQRVTLLHRLIAGAEAEQPRS